MRFFQSISLIPVLMLVLSCGAKAPPSLKSFEKPESPSGLGAVHTASGIHLGWQGRSSASGIGFVVLRDAGDGFKQIASVKDARYTDTVYKAGVPYKYKIVAKNPKGVLSDDSNAIEVMPLEIPQPPQGVSFRTEADSIIITWTHPDPNVLFNIYKSAEKGIYGVKPYNKEPISGTSFVDSVDVEKGVYYVVRALRGGALKHEGRASDELKVSPNDFVPGKPVGLKAVLTGEKIVLLWEENPETWVRGYRVYRSAEGGEFNAIGESQTPVFSDNDISGGKRIYKVKALGPVKEGPFSLPVEVFKK